MKRFENKVVVVTGGNSGIGFASAKRFHDEGAKVVIVGRSEDKVHAAAKELGSDVVGITADVSDLDALAAAFATIKEDLGSIDVLFANAGVAYFRPVSDVTPEFFDSITNINQKGLFFTLKNAVPLLNDGGSIVVNTSVVNEMGMPAASVYAATKAAARNLVRGFANELAPRKIRVNAVAPGPIETPIFAKTGMPAENLDEMSKGMVAQIPLQRFGKPEEIATAVAFLASDDASFVNGAELPVDGGLGQV
ncbi:MAG: SDR family oxidoreductase [Myxococcota bacterium]